MKGIIIILTTLFTSNFCIGQDNGESVVANVAYFEQSDTLGILSCKKYDSTEYIIQKYNMNQRKKAYNKIDSLSQSFPCYEFTLSSDCKFYLEDIAERDTCGYYHESTGYTTCINANLLILKRRRFKILGDGSKTIYCQEDLME